jgi:glycerol-3-phosphate dehydrogenase
MDHQPEQPFDVVVVGGGVVGCAVARLLSMQRTDGRPLTVALVEARTDVGAGTSKANTAILHTGFDATPGTLESRLVARGYRLLSDYAPAAGISVEPTGAVLVAWDDEQAANLPTLAAKATANGYAEATVVDAATVYELEPHLGPGVTGGMVVPGEHIIDPWGTPLAFAEQAIANGCHLLLGRRIVEVTHHADTTTLVTDTGEQIHTRYVVNAAGLQGDTLHRAFGLDGFTIRPRRGELIVFDKFARELLNGTVLPVPTATTKGVLVAPTVFGNVMLGPTADDIDDREATGSTRSGLDALLGKGRRIMPALLDEEVTAVYAGLRPACEHSDYQLSSDAALRYVCLGAIRSTDDRASARCSARDRGGGRPGRTHRGTVAARRRRGLGHRARTRTRTGWCAAPHRSPRLRHARSPSAHHGSALRATVGGGYRTGRRQHSLHHHGYRHRARRRRTRCHPCRRRGAVCGCGSAGHGGARTPTFGPACTG